MVNSVVFIDLRVENLQTLIDGAKPDQLVFVLDPDSNGIVQIATLLAENDLVGLDAISIVGHGFAGGLQLGSISLGQADLDGFAELLASIGAALSGDGDILLYGCDVGAGSAGAQLVADLTRLTGADVAASDDTTGSSSAGGDWDLEVRSGSIEGRNPFSDAALAEFEGHSPHLLPSARNPRVIGSTVRFLQV